jgi:carbon-monoxide dehydrogenase large subunit
MNEPIKRFGSAQGTLRREDQRFLSGRGTYTDDLNLPGQAHLVVLRSPHPHARIVSVDKTVALALPGVLGVWTGRDLLALGIGPIPFSPGTSKPDGSATTAPLRYPLTPDVARFVGDAVVAVVAETVQIARDATELVGVEYAELPAVAHPLAAAAQGAPALYDAAPGNIVAVSQHGDRAATDAAFLRATHVVRIELVNNRVAPSMLEPRAAMGEYDAASGRYTLHASCQNNAGARAGLAQGVLGVEEERVRVLVHDIGGGFGAKVFFYPEDALTVILAKQVGRPVKWRAERSESFLSDTHGRDNVTSAELALDGAGKFLALRIDLLAAMGAYLAFVGPTVPLMAGPRVATGAYDIPAAHFQGRAVLTNTAPLSAYRGAGRPESIYLIERLVDLAARQTGIDPLELRRRNFIPGNAFPYKVITGLTYDCGNFAEVMDRAVTRADWEGYATRKAGSLSRNKLRGRGIAYYIEWTGADPTERTVVEVFGDGRIVLMSGTQNMGQGLETSYAQLLSAEFGLPAEKIEIVQGDTDRITGVGSFGSRSLFVGGSAAIAGARAVIKKGQALAAETLEAAEPDITYERGRYTIAGTDRGIDLFELATRQPQKMFMAEAKFTVKGPSWPNGCHICEVEIDRDTGTVHVVKLTGLDDAGRIINPMIVEGQIHGGLGQGIGQALMEHVQYDDSGQLLTGAFLDYCLPRADDLPAFDLATYDGAPCTNNPLGSKGVGEIGAVVGPPVVVNAVVDALSEFGVTHVDMPVRGEDVWRLMSNGNGA